MIIRNVKRRDLSKIATLYTNIYNEYLPNEGWSQDTALRFIKYNFFKQKDLFFVAEESKDIIGFTFGYVKPWSDGDQLMAEELVVDKNYHKQGIATKLLKALIQTSYDKYKVTLVNATTYEEGGDGMPYAWYKRIELKKVEELFLIAGKPTEILQKIK